MARYELTDAEWKVIAPMPFLTWVMSKFLNLGFTLEQVIAMATITPRQSNRTRREAWHRLRRRFRVGACRGPVSFVDTRNNKRDGNVHLKPVQTVVAGIPFGRLFNAPFAVR